MIDTRKRALSALLVMVLAGSTFAGVPEAAAESATRADAEDRQAVDRNDLLADERNTVEVVRSHGASVVAVQIRIADVRRSPLQAGEDFEGGGSGFLIDGRRTQPANSTLVIAQQLFTTAFTKGQFGYATSMGVVLALVTLLFAGIGFIAAPSLAAILFPDDVSTTTTLKPNATARPSRRHRSKAASSPRSGHRW
jgi:hypothetical protein